MRTCVKFQYLTSIMIEWIIPMQKTDASMPRFKELGICSAVLKALDKIGYESPTPIQARIIPHMMQGLDVIGQAQTGTGKTAAFALPLICRLDLAKRFPQGLVLTPTRELAIQVAEAFQRYAANLPGFHVLPIYGGQEYRGQFMRLKQGVHVVVGTPGRVMDHIRRETLGLSGIDCLVLDEADEMLRMGFIDDVEWILDQLPPDRQTALFSATMPAPIKRIAQKYQKDPADIMIKARTTTVEATRQRYWMVSGMHKLDALTRILESEPFDGILIFVRTKTTTVELTEKLKARGYASAPLNGDIAQRQRERTVSDLKEGKLNILVATDVAARGLDLDRISHVVNYDIPYDTESYVHRIGRTGRAGRTGEAILFVTPRERHLLHAIEKSTRQKVELMDMPSTEMINDQRIARFKQRITDTLAAENLELYNQIVDQYRQEHNVPAIEIAGALARMVQGDRPLLLKHIPDRPKAEVKARKEKRRIREESPRESARPESGMERFKLEIGHRHGINPGNIVGAIANEAGISAEFIGRITIFTDFSYVDLPSGLPEDILRMIKKARLSGRPLNISKVEVNKPRKIIKKRSQFIQRSKKSYPRRKRH